MLIMSQKSSLGVIFWTLVNDIRITTGLVIFVQMILVNIKSVFCHLHNTKSLFTFYKRLDSDCPSQTKEKNLECATFGINKPVIEEFGNNKINS